MRANSAKATKSKPTPASSGTFEVATPLDATAMTDAIRTDAEGIDENVSSARDELNELLDAHDNGDARRFEAAFVRMSRVFINIEEQCARIVSAREGAK